MPVFPARCVLPLMEHAGRQFSSRFSSVSKRVSLRRIDSAGRSPGEFWFSSRRVRSY